MTPYYQDDAVTIYHGDCREILPQLEPVDLVLTDPPWITSNFNSDRAGHGVAKLVRGTRHLKYGAIGEFDSALLSQVSQYCVDMLVICGFKELGAVISTLAPIRGCFIWHKPNGAITHAYPTPLDIAYIVWGCKTKSRLIGYQHWKSGVFRFSTPSAGCISNGERILLEENGPAAHPCQGPVKLYSQLIKPDCFKTILDPFMGSGTTLRAAKDLGRKAIGIEIEEKYCEIAARRMAQEVLNFGGGQFLSYRAAAGRIT